MRLAVHTWTRSVTAVRLFVHVNFGASANISSIFFVFFFRQEIFSRKNSNEQYSFSYGSHILTWKMYICIFFVFFLLCKRVSQLWRNKKHNASESHSCDVTKNTMHGESHSCDATKNTMQASLTAVTLQKTQCTASLTAVKLQKTSWKRPSALWRDELTGIKHPHNPDRVKYLCRNYRWIHWRGLKKCFGTPYFRFPEYSFSTNITPPCGLYSGLNSGAA